MSGRNRQQESHRANPMRVLIVRRLRYSAAESAEGTTTKHRSALLLNDPNQAQYSRVILVLVQWCIHKDGRWGANGDLTRGLVNGDGLEVVVLVLINTLQQTAGTIQQDQRMTSNVRLA